MYEVREVSGLTRRKPIRRVAFAGLARACKLQTQKLVNYTGQQGLSDAVAVQVARYGLWRLGGDDTPTPPSITLTEKNGLTGGARVRRKDHQLSTNGASFGRTGLFAVRWTPTFSLVSSSRTDDHQQFQTADCMLGLPLSLVAQLEAHSSPAFFFS